MKNFLNFFITFAPHRIIGACIGVLVFFLVYVYFISVISTTIPDKEFVFYPRTSTPVNKYSNKQYESILDSLKHENDSLRNELRIYIDGCDHKEQIYEEIIYELQHNRTKKSNIIGTKDSL
jgi:hypothetical protein